MKAGRCGICIILTPLLRFFYHPRASITQLHVKNETFVLQCSNYLFSWVNVCSMIFSLITTLKRPGSNRIYIKSKHRDIITFLCCSLIQLVFTCRLSISNSHLVPSAPKSSILLKFTPAFQYITLESTLIFVYFPNVLYLKASYP